MAYLQPYFKDSKAFSQLHHQGFEHLILINICSSRRLKKKKKTIKRSREGQSNINDNNIMCIINTSLKT